MTKPLNDTVQEALSTWAGIDVHIVSVSYPRPFLPSVVSASPRLLRLSHVTPLYIQITVITVEALKASDTNLSFLHLLRS